MSALVASGSGTPREERPPYRILAPIRYPWTFNGPRRSRNTIVRRAFLPLNKVSRAVEGITWFNPLPARRFDLVHAFNRIPLGTTPFVIGFESHLPRAFGPRNERLFGAMCRLLASDRCRGIVAISQHAADIFRRQHRGGPHSRDMLAKLTTRYPNVDVAPASERRASTAEPFRLCFVGNHFGRKGGCVAVRVAELALEARLPVEVVVVSSLETGRCVWTDPTEPGFFAPYMKLLGLPNVRWFKALPNRDVLALMRGADMSLLTTLSDTCGFSAIESLAQGTPVLATMQGALPEIVEHGRSGFLLPLPVDEFREWEHLATQDRGSARFGRIVAEEFERLATAAMATISALIDTPAERDRLRREAHARAKRLFDTEDANLFWDLYYDKAIRRG